MELLRRSFLGAAVSETDEGIEVLQVWPGSMAERARLRPGDLIRGFDGPVASVAQLVEACRARAGWDSTLVFRRDGLIHEVDVPYVAFPDEAAPKAEVTYGEAGGLRTILVEPKQASDTLLVFLPGIERQSVDFALREEHPIARFLHDLGVATLRIDRPGLGDSPGPPSAGFLDENASYRAALEALDDGRRRVLFGHSVGGMHAPLLADLADALVVYGTSRRRWSTCLDESEARQRALRGLKKKKRTGWPKERARRFHEELDDVDLGAAWDALAIPHLVVIGEHDWVVGEDEQRELGGDVLALDGLDHAFTRHPSKDESLAHLGRGSYDPRVARGVARWITSGASR